MICVSATADNSRFRIQTLKLVVGMKRRNLDKLVVVRLVEYLLDHIDTGEVLGESGQAVWRHNNRRFPNVVRKLLYTFALLEDVARNLGRIGLLTNTDRHCEMLSMPDTSAQDVHLTTKRRAPLSTAWRANGHRLFFTTTLLIQDMTAARTGHVDRDRRRARRANACISGAAVRTRPRLISNRPARDQTWAM